MDTIFLIGRIIFGGYFIYNGVNHILHHKNLAGYAKMKGVPAASFSVVFSGAIMLLGGLSILLNFRIILGFWLIVLFLVPTTFIMHAFWKEKDPSAKMNETIAFTKNAALIGACLMMIASLFVPF